MSNGVGNPSRFARTYVAASLAGLVVVHPAAFAQSGNEGAETGGAASGVGVRNVVVVPRISLTESYSNNVRLQSGGGQSDLTSTISPGISIRSDAGRLRGYLDYSLSQVMYARNASENNLQNALNAALTYEAVSNFAFIDINGSVGQQSISAFGQQSVDNSSINRNRTEVSTVSVSPYVRGRLANVGSYQVRYVRTATRSKGENGTDGDTQDLSATLSGESNSRLLSWSATGIHAEQDYSGGRGSESDRLRAVVTAAITPQYNVSVNGGRESNNYVSSDKQSKNTYGFGFNAAISERTRFNAQIERRFFGTGHSVTLDHRTGHTVWRLSDTKDVSVSPNVLGSAGSRPLYDLYFSLFASIEPDPVRRAALVESFLRANGLNGTTTVPIGFLTSGATLQRQQSLSFSIQGLRDTVSLIANRSASSALTNGVGGTSDFATSSQIRQFGLNANYSHRLTQETSLNVLVSQLRSSGDSGAQSSTLKSLNVTVSTRLGLRTSASFGARHTMFDSVVAPYKESAAFGSISVQF